MGAGGIAAVLVGILRWDYKARTDDAQRKGKRGAAQRRIRLTDGLCNKQEIDMETMSQFASEKDLWKARCLRFATALDDVMDGMQDHDIQAETGLPDEDCERIANARADARTLVHSAALTGFPVESTVMRGGSND